jgi:hypothetical protein
MPGQRHGASYPQVRWNVEGEWENLLTAPAGMQKLVLSPGSGVASGI